MTRLERYVRDQIELFSRDPPLTDYEKGYLASLTVTAVEGLGLPLDDPAIQVALQGIPETFLLPRRDLPLDGADTSLARCRPRASRT